jgi:hypothetical protein
VVQDAVNLNLSPDEVLLACKGTLENLLDSKVSSIGLSRCGVDSAEVTRPERLEQLIVFLELVLLLGFMK